MHYKFTDNCLIGVEQIDEEHRKLFQLVGEVQKLLNDKWSGDRYSEICDVIESLKEYAEEHFRHEEEYMEQIGHPELKMQREQHALFCKKVNEVDLKSAKDNPQDFISDLLSFLAKWLYKHILGSDLLIGKLMSVKEWKKMESIAFTERYQTGIESIDAEHHELFKILDELRYLILEDDNADKYDEILNLAKHFRNNIEVHFKNEEEYMESIQYEELEVQHLAHDVFITRLELMNLDAFDMTRLDELGECVEVMTEWFSAHIINMDKRIGRV